MISYSAKSTVHNNKHYYYHRIAIYCLFLFSILLLSTPPSAAIRMPPLHDGGSPTMSLERHNSLNSNEDEKKYTPISSTRGGAISTDVATTQQPSKLRSVLFPIYGPDVKKFFLLGAIKFFIIMALTLTRDNKDTMIVTTCGAEAIAFLKVCVYVLCM